MTERCHKEVIVSPSLVRRLCCPTSCCDLLTLDVPAKHRFFAKWPSLQFSVIAFMFEMERLKGLISFYGLKIIEVKHQHGNISFSIPDKITAPMHN